MKQNPRITGASIMTVYVDDYKKALDFYSGILGLEKAVDMGEDACFFRFGDDRGSGLYLEGGNRPNTVDEKTVRTAFVLEVDDAGAMFVALKNAEVDIVQSEPIPMGEGRSWFQFHDPAGNLLEVLGPLEGSD